MVISRARDHGSAEMSMAAATVRRRKTWL